MSEPVVVTVDPVVTATMHTVVAASGVREFFDTAFQTLAKATASQQVEIAGPAFALFRGHPGTELDVEVGFPTDLPVEPDGEVRVGVLPGGELARLVHEGGFGNLGASWDRMRSWLTTNDLLGQAQRWEVYRTKPGPDVDPETLRTELNWPLLPVSTDDLDLELQARRLGKEHRRNIIRLRNGITADLFDTAPAAPPAPDEHPSDTDIIRRWAVENGFDTPAADPLPHDITTAYHQAHP